MNRLLADPAEIDRVLADGARKAQRDRRPIVEPVKDIVGLLRSREFGRAAPNVVYCCRPQPVAA